MTRSQKTYGKVALLMAGIVAASAVLTFFTGADRRETGKVRIAASFYPVYIAALNLARGLDGVEVVSLTGPTAGCLHDYQLSPDNRITLSGADMLVINGAGAESFLDGVLAETPELPVIDTSAGIPLLHAGEGAADTEHDDHDHDHIHDNEHIWTSPALYRRQVENLRDGLCRYDPDNAEAYRKNAASYLSRVDEAGARLRQAAASLPYTSVITFHDSLAYLADYLELTVVAALSMGEDSGVAASDLARAEEAAKNAGQVLLLYDSQYPVEYAYVGAAAKDSRTLALDTGVSGADAADAWLNAMEKNLDMLQGGAKA